MVGSQGILKSAVLFQRQRPTDFQIICDIEVVNEVFRYFQFNEFYAIDLCMSFFIRVITIDTDILSLLLVINCGTVILKSVILHCAIHITLCGFFSFSQSLIVQLVIKAVFKVVVGSYQITVWVRLLCNFGADFALIFLCNGFLFISRILSQDIISFVSGEHFLESGTVLCSEDRVKKCRITKLHFAVSDFLHQKGGIIQINGVAHLVIPGRLCFIVAFYFFIGHIDKVAEIQIFQLVCDQFFQRIALSAFNQGFSQVTLNAEVYQIGIALNRNLIIGNSGVSNTHLGKIGEVCRGVIFSFAELVNHFLGSIQSRSFFQLIQLICKFFGFTLGIKGTIEPVRCFIIGVTLIVVDNKRRFKGIRCQLCRITNIIFREYNHFFNRLLLIYDREISCVKVAFKGFSVDFYRFLFRYAR